MLSFLKNKSPNFLKTLARKTRRMLYETSDKLKPYLIHRKYCGYRLYYTRGAGLIDRIRIGNINKIYEPELVNSICDELKKHESPVFLDIGTNIGLISLAVLKTIPNVKIFCFEPGPIPYASFTSTILANKLSDKVKLYNEALNKESGYIDFYMHNDKDSSGDGMIDTRRSESDSTRITVKSTTLDEWSNLNNEEKINVVKIDIEGAELCALQGSIEFLSKNKPIIFLEISKENLKVYPHNELDILNFFESNDYNLFNLSNMKINQDNIKNIVDTEDTFIAKPKK